MHGARHGMVGIACMWPNKKMRSSIFQQYEHSAGLIPSNIIFLISFLKSVLCNAAGFVLIFSKSIGCGNGK